MTERRKHTRYEVREGEAWVELGDCRYRADLMDISKGGAKLVFSLEDWAALEECPQICVRIELLGTRHWFNGFVAWTSIEDIQVKVGLSMIEVEESDLIPLLHILSNAETDSAAFNLA